MVKITTMYKNGKPSGRARAIEAALRQETQVFASTASADPQAPGETERGALRKILL